MKKRISVDKNRIVIRPDVKYTSIGILSIIIALFMSGVMIDFIVSEELGLSVLFFSIVMLFSVIGVLIIKSYSKMIVIDEAGVHSKLVFFNSFLSWNEIEDYGISYDGGSHTCGWLFPMEVYVLYFAAKKQNTITLGSKRLRGRMIKRKFADCNIEQLNAKVTSFCNKYAQVSPFNECVNPSYEKSDRVKQNKRKTTMKIKPNKKYIINGFICLLVAVIVVGAFISLAIEKKHVSMFLFAEMSVCVLLLVLGIYAVILSFKTLTVDKNGIRSKCGFFEKQISWNEVRDYGIAYVGEVRFDGELYVLYFTCETLKTKKNSKKKFKGKTIKTFVSYEEYDVFEREVFSFCKKFTSLQPYDAT